MIRDADTLPLAMLAAGAAAVFWLWRRQQNGTDPQELPTADAGPNVQIQGPSFVEDNPTDEVVGTLLSADIARRPYSVRYDDGGTSLYMRFVDDYAKAAELGQAELQAWLNDNRKQPK